MNHQLLLFRLNLLIYKLKHMYTDFMIYTFKKLQSYKYIFKIQRDMRFLITISELFIKKKKKKY